MLSSQSIRTIHLATKLDISIGNYGATEFDYRIGHSTVETEFNTSDLDILYKYQYYELTSFEFVFDNLNDNLAPSNGLKISMIGNFSNNYGKFNFFAFKSYFDLYIPIKKHSFRNLVYFNFEVSRA